MTILHTGREQLARSMIGLCSMSVLLGPVTVAVSPARATPLDLSTTEYGYSVSISGSTFVVGAPGLNQGQGAVYIFARSARAWHYQARIHDPARRDQDTFGFSVAVASAKTGPYLAIGEETDNFYPNIAYVYHRSGRTWRRQAILHDPESYYGDNFGSSVAMTSTTLVVGSFSAGNLEGAAYIYSRSGTTWKLRATFNDPQGNFGDYFGYSVAVSGHTVIATTAIGLAYVYSTVNGRDWSQSAVIPNPADPSDRFGASAALSGKTAVIGAPGDGTRFSQGAAYVFVRSGTKWKATGRLISPNGITDDQFGEAVSVSGDRALVGAPLHGKRNCGTAYEFLWNGTRWKRRQTVVEPPPCVPGDHFGWSTSVSARTGVIGAPDENKAFHVSLP